MVVFKEITAAKERKSVYPERHVWLPCLTTAEFGSVEHDQWVEENWWMVNYSVFMDDKPEAVRLAAELDNAFKRSPNDEAIPGILEKLQRLKVKDHNKLTPVERWTRNAFQYVDYTGGFFVHEAICNRLAKYSGSVLEAMCGHTSYFPPSPAQTVTALDYCEESLLKYPYPERRRFECDLNQVETGTHLPFFRDGEFDAISICFGFKYPRRLDLVVKEFLRILRLGGTLSFVENPKHGYEDLTHRRFNAASARALLMKAGYTSVQIRSIKMDAKIWCKDRGTFYHLEATK